jgi:hypothetical protein
LCRRAFFVPVLIVKPALKRFHTAWADFCRSTLTPVQSPALERQLEALRQQLGKQPLGAHPGA